MIHTLVYQEIESIGMTKCWFKFHKQSDEYDPQVIVLKTQATLYVVN